MQPKFTISVPEADVLELTSTSNFTNAPQLKLNDLIDGENLNLDGTIDVDWGRWNADLLA